MLYPSSGTKFFNGREFSSFNGCIQYDSVDPLSIPFGRLIFNKNLEYYYSNNQIYITTRFGSSLIKDITTAVYGASNYNYDLTTDYLTWIDSAGALKYYNESTDAIVSIKTGLDKSAHNFYMFGIETLSALYGCSEVDGVYKVSGSSPTYSAIAGSPNLTDITFSSISGRFIGVYKQTVYYSQIQQLDADNLTNLEKWNRVEGLTRVTYTGLTGVFVEGENVLQATSGASGQIVAVNGTTSIDILTSSVSETFTDTYVITGSGSGAVATQSGDSEKITDTLENTAKPSPDNGRGYQAVIDDGEATYLFKDTGILCLPNANEDVTNWYFPKIKAKYGTISGKTVALAKFGEQAGIIYLGVDKKLRFIAPKIIRNAGVLPTITNDESHPISLAFQDYMDKIPDAQLSKCTGQYYDNKYFLNIVSESGTSIDFTIIIDCEKLMPAQGSEYPQPFWYESSNLDFTNFVQRERENELYGFHKSGYIVKMFDKTKHVDEVPTRIDASGELTIEWKWILGWFKYTEKDAQLVKGYFYWATDGAWNITATVNAFRFGDAIPQFDTGLTATLKPNDVSGSYFDISQFDVGRFSSVNNAISQDSNVSIKGNYFLFGAWDNTKGRYATFYGLQPIFKNIRKSPVSQR